MVFNPAHADKLLEGTGHMPGELFALAKDRKPLPHFYLPVRIRTTARMQKKTFPSANILARLEGSDPKLKSEYVVLSAHIDHLGIGKPLNGDRIYHGAIDNASGVAALLDIADELKREHVRPKRSILFAFFTGEELGLLGSKYFTAHPTVDARSMVANLNVDSIHALLPMKEVEVYGIDESDLGDVARRAAASQNMTADSEPQLHPTQLLCYCSDHTNFVLHGIPTIRLMVGFPGESGTLLQKFRGERYHTPLDNSQQPVNLETVAKFEEITREVLLEVANDSHRPQWKANSFYRRYEAK